MTYQDFVEAQHALRDLHAERRTFNAVVLLCVSAYLCKTPAVLF